MSAAQTEKRLSLVASKASFREPFVFAVSAKLGRVVTDEAINGVDSACTDGVTMRFYSPYCEALSDDQLMTLFLHESMHVVLMHPWRRQGRDPKLFNIAADIALDSILLEQGYEFTDEWRQFLTKADEHAGCALAGKSTEAIYSILQKKADEGASPMKSVGGAGGPGDVKDAPAEATAEDAEATIMTAAKMAKACGAGSPFLDMVLDGALSTKVSWIDHLRFLLVSSSRSDYTFGKTNRRFVSQGLYMPTLHSESMGGLVVAIDTSGSMGQEELNQAASEINAIRDQCAPDWVRVLYCDSKVHAGATQHFDEHDEIVLVAKGGGGTAFAPVFEHVQAWDEQVAALIYFTDLYGDTNIAAPEYPVLWAVSGGERKVPFGEVIQV